MSGLFAPSRVLHRAPVPRAAMQFVSLGARPELSRGALVAVVLLHAVLIHLLVTGMRHTVPDSAPRPFTVEWIAARPADAELPVPQWPDLPSRPRPQAATTQPGVSPNRLGEASPVLETLDHPEVATQARLFDGEGRPRVEGDTPVPRWTDSDRILRDRIVNLPGGSDAQAAYHVQLRLRRAFVPRDVVVSVLRLLFGTPRPDDCAAIEQRLRHSDPGVSREIDLVKLRKTCVGTP